MTLIDLLQVLSNDITVGIWNIDDKRAKQPTPQAYQKVGNIPLRKISNILYYEVLYINVIEKNGAYLLGYITRNALIIVISIWIWHKK